MATGEVAPQSDRNAGARAPCATDIRRGVPPTRRWKAPRRDGSEGVPACACTPARYAVGDADIMVEHRRGAAKAQNLQI